jgi:hypothetical protein
MLSADQNLPAKLFGWFGDQRPEILSRQFP